MCVQVMCKGMIYTGPPREILQGETRLLWGPGDRLRLFSKLRSNKTTGKLS